MHVNLLFTSVGADFFFFVLGGGGGGENPTTGKDI